MLHGITKNLILKEEEPIKEELVECTVIPTD
jgi:hypothetical protein